MTRTCLRGILLEWGRLTHMGSIGLGEALSLWFSGQKLDGIAIWGVPTLLIARVAKIVIYLSAFTVVLDIIGPERIREFGERVRESHSKRLREWRTKVHRKYGFLSTAAPATLCMTVAGTASQTALSLPVLLISAASVVWSYLIGSDGLVRVIVDFGNALARPNLGRAIRVSAFGLLTLATPADLLTS